MSLAKFQATHAVVNNAPQIINLAADDPVLLQRVFINSGAPSSTTLAPGNGKYLGASSGFIVAASLVAAGTGYAVGNVLTVSGGTATTTCQITVDAITTAGAIVDWHVSRTGVYTAYPNNAVSVTGGTGTGATFNLAIPPTDFYIDFSTPTAPVMYVCTTAGTNATSVWAKIGGGSSGGWNARGVWIAGLIYNTNDAVTLGAGTSSGMYISLIDSNLNSPDSGIGWWQIGGTLWL